MLDFPSSPTSGQYYTSSVRSWRYNGTTWVLLDDPWLDADSFSGFYPSYFLNLGTHTGSITSSNVSNFNTAVTAVLNISSIDTLSDVDVTSTPPDEFIFNILQYRDAGYWEPSKFISDHINDTSIHYDTSSISITTGQVVGFIEAVQDVIGTGTFLKGSNGISGIYDDTANTLTLSGVSATSILRGVASFDATHFTVVTGKVSLSSVPLALIATNTGPYILGVSSVGIDTSPVALSTSSVATMLTGYLTTPAAVTGIVTGLTTGYLSKSNNLSDVGNVNTSRKNLKVRYQVEDFTPLDGTVWSSSSSGLGGTYQYDPQFVPALRGLGMHGVTVVSAGTGTGLLDAAMRYHTNAGYWLSTGSEFYFRVMRSTINKGNVYRFGLLNAFGTNSGDVADGIYFEMNGSTGNQILACNASGNTRTKTVTSYSPTVDQFEWFSMKFLGTGAEFYSDGTATPIGSVYTNYPGPTTSAMRAFFQCCGTGSSRNLWVDKIAVPLIQESLPSGIP